VNVTIVTAIYGGYDKPKPLPAAVLDNADARLYTDDDRIAREAIELGWHAILDEYPTGDKLLSAMLRAKFIKTHPHLAAPKADISIWIDGSMTVTVPDFVQRCLGALGDDDLSMTPHPWRNCIWSEAIVTAQLPRYDDVDPIKQVNFYGDVVGHPRNWGLFASGAFTVRHTLLTEQWGGHWYHDCVFHTYQDQLSLPVITRLMAEERGLKWNTNMPWAEWWGITNHGC
jgi:hypothetical protein